MHLDYKVVCFIHTDDSNLRWAKNKERIDCLTQSCVLCVCREKEDVELMEKMLLRKCDSLPHLVVGENLLDELGIETGRKSAMSLADARHDDFEDDDALPSERASFLQIKKNGIICA